MDATILSFDPGLSFSGWTYSRADDTAFTVLDFGMLTPNKSVGHKEYREQVGTYGVRVVTLCLLRDMVRELMNRFHPTYVVSEAAFFNPGRPGAYEALVHWIMTVSFVLRDDYAMKLYTIPPTLAKKTVSGTGKSGKVDVASAVLGNPEIRFMNKPALEDLTEHEGDSMAIGYSLWKLYLHPKPKGK